MDDTKYTIIRTALHLFAERGLDGVSLSELRSASGQNNRSAIHYHFGNKDGLLDAVTEHVSQIFELPMRESVADGWQMARSRELTIDRFIRIMSKPFLTVYAQGTEGRDCVRMISHLSHENTDKQQARAFIPMQRYMGEMAALLQTLLPGRTNNELAPLLFISTCSILESLICSGMLMREHELAGAHIAPPDPSDFIEMVLSFAQGGLQAASQLLQVSLT